MYISAVNNCNFNGLYYSVKSGAKPTKEQIRLKRLIEDIFNDDLCSDYNLIENLEKIAGADVFITMEQCKGEDVVYLDVRKRKGLSEKLTKEEQAFYKYSNEETILIAKESNADLNNYKIQNFYKTCKNFVRKILASGKNVA